MTRAELERENETQRYQIELLKNDVRDRTNEALINSRRLNAIAAGIYTKLSLKKGDVLVLKGEDITPEDCSRLKAAIESYAGTNISVLCLADKMFVQQLSEQGITRLLAGRFPSLQTEKSQS